MCQFLANCRFLAICSHLWADFSRFLPVFAKETPEFFDNIVGRLQPIFYPFSPRKRQSSSTIFGLKNLHLCLQTWLINRVPRQFWVNLRSLWRQSARFTFEPLGRDMGGAKGMGGGKRTRERALPKIIGPLQKSFWSALSFCAGKTEHWHLRGVENVPYEGGSKTPFWEGYHSWGFQPPLFLSPPLIASSELFESCLGHFASLCVL